MAGKSQSHRARPILIHDLLISAWLCDSPMFHNDLLLHGHQEIAQRCQKDQSTEGKTSLSPQGHQTGANRYHRLHSLLAALLAGPGLANQFAH